LIDFLPYQIHHILIDNGTEFAHKEMDQDKRPKNRGGQAEYTSSFFSACKKNGIKHKMTKFRAPWTNGQIERLIVVSKIILSLRLTTLSYEALDLARWQDQYNLETRLRSIKNLTPYEKVVEYFNAYPERFSRRPARRYFCTTNW
jgi:transposase InsO family protein